ncbi:hypothetical protein ILUMI_10718 [Ignelater luminosus]|uniref:Uncharacterized protein n=1 Tax=Ignelater luminosus TaxID=2038154 RepID=A0A8K0CZV7_IGNLU|nr:hypothetical protein ILUMI_10718 [Ignelater luminosus]
MGFRIKTERCLAVIVVCAVLHNIALDHNDSEPPHDATLELQQEDGLLIETAVEELRLAPGANQNILVRDALLGTVYPAEILIQAEKDKHEAEKLLYRQEKAKDKELAKQ